MSETVGNWYWTAFTYIIKSYKTERHITRNVPQLTPKLCLGVTPELSGKVPVAPGQGSALDYSSNPSRGTITFPLPRHPPPRCWIHQDTHCLISLPFKAAELPEPPPQSMALSGYSSSEYHAVFKYLILAFTLTFLYIERARKALCTPVFPSQGTLSQSVSKNVQSNGGDPELRQWYLTTLHALI